MKVRIDYTVDVDDSFREEVRIYYGKKGKASRQEVKDWFRMYGDSMNDDLGSAAQEREEWAETKRHLDYLDEGE